MLNNLNWLKLRVNWNYTCSFKLTHKNLNYAPHLRIKMYVRIFHFYFTYSFFNGFVVYFFVFQFSKSHTVTDVSHGKKLRLSNFIVSCLEKQMNGSRGRWMILVLPRSLRLGTTTSLTGSFVPCQRDDMRKPAASICVLGRWLSH